MEMPSAIRLAKPSVMTTVTPRLPPATDAIVENVVMMPSRPPNTMDLICEEEGGAVWEAYVVPGRRRVRDAKRPPAGGAAPCVCPNLCTTRVPSLPRSCAPHAASLPPAGRTHEVAAQAAVVLLGLAGLLGDVHRARCLHVAGLVCRQRGVRVVGVAAAE
jgi:hypothetical protein